MSYRVNYGGVSEATSFEPVPEDDYNVEIQKVQETTASSGRPLIKVRYVILDGPYKDRMLFDQVTLFEGNEKGAGFTKHFLHVIGEPYQGEFDVDPDNWIGKRLRVSVTIEPYKDSKNNKVKARESLEPGGEIPF